MLLGLSIWHSAEFGVSGSFKLQAELEQKLKTVDTRVAAIAGAPAKRCRFADLKHDTSVAVADPTRATANAQATADRAVMWPRLESRRPAAGLLCPPLCLCQPARGALDSFL